MSTPPSYLRAVTTSPDPPAGEPEHIDRHVLLAAQGGDVRAWSRLYERHYLEVFRQLRYLAGDAALAEELAQETFAQAIAGYARFDPSRSFAGWLHGIALNVVRKHWRKQQNAARAYERLAQLTRMGPPGGDPDSSHVRSERGRALALALESLPARWREAFVLRELQGLPAAEVAGLLGITPENLAVRVNRARMRIRDELARQGWLAGAHQGAV